MINSIKQRLDQVPEGPARIMNQLGSTIAGLMFFAIFFLAFDTSVSKLVGLLFVAGLFDFSTVYFVHSGVISGTFERLKYPKQFMRLHVGSGFLAYIFLFGFIASLFVARIDLLYYAFLASWLVTYLSGVYSFLKLR